MAFQLRPYQSEAVEAAIAFMKRCLDPCIIEAATGAGKSLIVSEIAIWINKASNKKVLCLAPSKELTEQNAEKYRAYGLKSSLWSASVGRKDMVNNVVFGTPKSVLNDIQKFGTQFAGVIIDEAHGITPTIKKIIHHMKDQNPRIRVVGLSATPYRLGSGYIYEYDEDNNPIGEECARSPFFKKLVYRITAHTLIEQGYLTPPVANAELSASYDAAKLTLNKQNKFDSKEVEEVFEGHGRLTASIVEDVVSKSAGKMGVMFFAATIQHAKEVLASLPKNNAKMVTGETKKREREQIINQFKSGQFKYLINVAVLTTGFDAPHVDVIAILRATESASLLQQIIGRGLRLHDEKLTCLVLDYAGNIERHGLEDDLFSPQISVSGGGEGSVKVDAQCIKCGTVNSFSLRKGSDPDRIDSEGYEVDLAGDRVVVEGQPLPGHYGRRCFGGAVVNGHYERCDHRWSMKICPECEAENDIAARYCTSCKQELVDPNEKLKIDYKKMKEDPKALSTDKVLGWSAKSWVSQGGNKTLRVDYTTEYRTFPVWYSPFSNNVKQQALWANLCEAVFGKGHIAPDPDKFTEALKKGYGFMPETLMVRKEGDFFRVFAHNLPEDEKPS